MSSSICSRSWKDFTRRSLSQCYLCKSIFLYRVTNLRRHMEARHATLFMFSYESCETRYSFKYSANRQRKISRSVKVLNCFRKLEHDISFLFFCILLLNHFNLFWIININMNDYDDRFFLSFFDDLKLLWVWNVLFIIIDMKLRKCR